MKTTSLIVLLILAWSCSRAPEIADDSLAEPSAAPQLTTGMVEAVRIAAEQGEAHAQTSLGLLYSQGKGVPQDSQEAAKWFRKAAEQGDGFGQLMLGQKDAEGEGVPRDLVKALAWFTLAAAQGTELDEPRDDLEEIKQGMLKEGMTSGQAAQAQKLAAELYQQIRDRRETDQHKAPDF